tara:strand:- start:1606 stop:2733 length:1128 start_codon:yes stop_codon:yes gene_type:complete
MIDFRGAHKLWPGSAPVEESVELDEVKISRDPQLVLGLGKGEKAGHWLKNKSKDKKGKLHPIHKDKSYIRAKTKKQKQKAIDQWNLKNPMDLWVGESVELDERTAPLPKATAFAITYSYAGKDHKFVTKLTNIGGKVDRKKKEVRFDFDSASARTKFRKKNKKVLDSLNEYGGGSVKESVELDEAVDHKMLHKTALQIMKEIDRAEGRKNKWVDSWGDKVKNTINPETDTNSISTPTFYGGRNTNWQFSLIKDGSKIIVKYDYLGPASKMQKDMNRVGSSGKVNLGVFTDMILKMNESVKEEAPLNSAGDGSRIAGLGDEPPVRKKKKKLDGRTKEFKEKVKSLADARARREKVKLEKRWGIRLKENALEKKKKK